MLEKYGLILLYTKMRLDIKQRRKKLYFDIKVVKSLYLRLREGQVS